MAIELTTATAEQINGIQNALNLNVPVVTEYPTTDATKVGQKFIYKGNEWKYHSQAELDGLGWTTVSEGFPAPVVKAFNPLIFCQDAPAAIRDTVSGIEEIHFDPKFGGISTIDFLGLGDVTRFKNVFIGFSYISSEIALFRNASLLTSLEDVGTLQSLTFGGSSKIISSDTLNDLFTQLPPTLKTVTINLTLVSGAATCDTTIATSKGYTVVT